MKHVKMCGLWVAMLALAGPASAVPLTFQYNGTVTEVNDPSNHLDGGVSVEMQFSGLYSFDSNAPDQSPSSSIGTYATIPPLTLELGTLPLLSQNGRSLSIQNSLPGAGYDKYRLDDYSFTSESFDILEFTISLSDPTGTALSSDHLPLEPPAMSAFPYTYFLVQGRRTGSTSYHFAIEGTIDSIISIPEPGSLVLVAAGSALLLRCRRKSARVLLGLTPFFFCDHSRGLG